MRCTACGHENRETSAFCEACGTRLTMTCLRCAAELRAGARFCDACGQPVGEAPARAAAPDPGSSTPRHPAELAGRPSLEGERKLVTVLIADVAGSTSLAEHLDPEEVHGIIERYVELMVGEVHRYEGTVSQFTGDGILALFGAPIAHEDHAQRAVRAALGIQQVLRGYQRELQERLGIVFQVRIGLNSGPVVVGTIGTDLHQTYTALGDAVNLASRIQTLAEPGAVVISQATNRLVSGYFVTRDLGEHQVRGKEATVGLLEVLRPSRWRTRLDVYTERGLSPLIGRERELQTLLERCEEARAGHGQLVMISGDPGIGKSRLLHELKRRLEGETLSWLEGRCIAYGQDVPYLPIVDLLKDSFGVDEADGEAAIVRKVEAGARALGSAVLSVLPSLKFVLSVDPGEDGVATMDPQMRKARIFEALRTLAIAGSAIRPLVIVLEDLHWLDRLSEEYVSYLADVIPDRPILLLLTHRPGYEHPFGDRSFHTRLALGSLSRRESATLATGMLAAESLPDEIQQVVAARAEGNPFFIEEVIRSLLDVEAIRRDGAHYVLTGRVEDLYVPDTVQDVIMARLDRLEDEPKRAIQTAAVIGREFTVRLLDRTTELRGQLGGYLRELKAVELIYERALYPELAYMFKHALTHDVAYNSLLLARRKVLHRLVGEGIEALYADRLGEQYETLAYHYERGEAWDKALDYLQMSGEKALAAFAPQQAVGFYDRILAVVQKSGLTLTPRRAVVVQAGRGQAHFLSGHRHESAASYQAMLEAALAAADPGQEGEALHQLSIVSLFAHRFEEALAYAERARQLALRTGNQAVLAGSLYTAASVRANTGDLENARAGFESAMQVANEASIPVMQAAVFERLAMLEHWRGDHGEAVELYERANTLGREHQVAMVLVMSLWSEALAYCGAGRYDEALRNLHEHLELTARLGDARWRCRTLNTLGWVYLDLCNWDLAIQYNAQGAAESRVVDDPEIIRNADLNLADCYLALGRLDEAQRLLEATEIACRQQGTWGEEWMKWRYIQHLHASLGELWLLRGDAARALDLAEACLTAAVSTGGRRNIVKGQRLKGEALLAQGDVAGAETELEAALKVARHVGNPHQLWKTLTALARLRQAQARPDDATTACQEALDTLERAAASLSDPALRASLLASPQATGLRDALALARQAYSPDPA